MCGLMYHIREFGEAFASLEAVSLLRFCLALLHCCELCSAESRSQLEGICEWNPSGFTSSECDAQQPELKLGLQCLNSCFCKGIYLTPQLLEAPSVVSTCRLLLLSLFICKIINLHLIFASSLYRFKKGLLAYLFLLMECLFIEWFYLI